MGTDLLGAKRVANLHGRLKFGACLDLACLICELAEAGDPIGNMKPEILLGI